MTSHSLLLRLLEYDIFILILAHLEKIPNGFYMGFFGIVGGAIRILTVANL